MKYRKLVGHLSLNAINRIHFPLKVIIKGNVWFIFFLSVNLFFFYFLYNQLSLLADHYTRTVYTQHSIATAPPQESVAQQTFNASSIINFRSQLIANAADAVKAVIFYIFMPFLLCTAVTPAKIIAVYNRLPPKLLLKEWIQDLKLLFRSELYVLTKSVTLVFYIYVIWFLVVSLIRHYLSFVNIVITLSLITVITVLGYMVLRSAFQLILVPPISCLTGLSPSLSEPIGIEYLLKGSWCVITELVSAAAISFLAYLTVTAYTYFRNENDILGLNNPFFNPSALYTGIIIWSFYCLMTVRLMGFLHSKQ